MTPALHLLRVAVLLAGLAPAAQAADRLTRLDDLGTLGAPVTTSFGGSFTDLDATVAGIQLAPGGTPVTLQTGDSFVEDWRFTLPADALASAILGTIDLAPALDLQGLSVRLYRGDALPAGTLGGASPLAATAAEAVFAGNGELQSIDGLRLPAGIYVLELSGEVAGSSGGSYAAVLNLSPVPEPGALAAALAGLLVLLRHGRYRDTPRSR